jgi:hypothetical protein
MTFMPDARFVDLQCDPGLPSWADMVGHYLKTFLDSIFS